jgi:hypothetical protein
MTTADDGTATAVDPYPADPAALAEQMAAATAALRAGLSAPVVTADGDAAAPA